jgi:hypothetical protein
MINFIVKLAENKYIEWSELSAGPVSALMSREDVLVHVTELEYSESRDRSGAQAMAEKLLSLADLTSTSSSDGIGLAQISVYNRAGQNGTKLTLDEIIRVYTFSSADKDKWPWS